METSIVILSLIMASALLISGVAGIAAYCYMRWLQSQDLLKRKDAELQRLKLEWVSYKESLDIQNERLANRNLELHEQVRSLEEQWRQRFEAWKIQETKEIRANALKKSRHILRGQATEHLAPLMIEGWSPKDFRFIGNPIDYLVVLGASDITDKQANEVSSVILLDIKTGKSKLNKVQRRIRDAVIQGRVKFCTYNPDKEELREYPCQ